MRIVSLIGSVLAVAGAVAGCGRNDATPAPRPSTTASDRPATTAPPADPTSAKHRVDLMPGQGGEVTGAIEFVTHDGAVTMTGLVAGLKPGSEHGFHIHEKGDCSSPDFKSAGDHFNPTAQEHGDPATPPHHLGDIPNLKADEMGKAPVNAHIEGVTLGDGGPNDLGGRAVVVHAERDDYKTQPSGNSGDRIACGVIQ